MLDLSKIPEDVRLARGDYATVRAAHEDAKKEMARHCSQLQGYAAQILRKMQPTDDEVPESVADLLTWSRGVLVLMEQCAGNIESLAQQRIELRKKAWK